MRTLSLDYRPGGRRHPLARWVALILAALALVAVWSYYRDLADRIDLLRSATEPASPRAGGRAAREAPDPVQARRAAAELNEAREVLGRLAFPWDRLFSAIETATNQDVAPLGIDPDPRKGTVNIHGEARSFAAMLGFSDRLLQSGMFATVVIQQHEVEQEDPERPIRFLIAAAWKVPR